MGDFDEHKQPESRYPGLNRSPTGSSWPDAPHSEPRKRLWPIAVSGLVLIGVIAAIVLFAQR